jgi:hypothetical protein
MRGVNMITMQLNIQINKQNQIINLGQPLEVELKDGQIIQGSFYGKRELTNKELEMVIIQTVSDEQVKVHYFKESTISEVRFLGPYGKPNLYRIK